MSKNLRNWWKSMIIANIDREILHNFWTTSGISMKFSRKMFLMIILKVTKNQGFVLSLEDTFFEKPQGAGGSNWPHPIPSRFRVESPVEWVYLISSLISFHYSFIYKWNQNLAHFCLNFCQMFSEALKFISTYMELGGIFNNNSSPSQQFYVIIT